LLAIGFVWNDGRCSALGEPFAQFGTVVGFVAKQLLGRFGTPDQPLGRWAIVGLTACQ
jgi:hypothetical protein